MAARIAPWLLLEACLLLVGTSHTTVSGFCLPRLQPCVHLGGKPLALCRALPCTKSLLRASNDDGVSAAGDDSSTSSRPNGESGGVKKVGPASGEGGSKTPLASKARSPLQAEEKVDLWTFVFGKPGELDRDLARMGTSRARFLRINFAALLFALAANFLGVTSFLLGLLPDLQGLYVVPAELTQFYPVKGWKRFRGEGTFEFIYPARWLQDQAVALANQARGVEDQLQTAQSRRKRLAPSVRTVAAFGPPRGDASENVSVVRSQLGGALALKNLGTPEDAAQRLLDTAIAPEVPG
jgi:hypothetical protein